MTTTITPGTTVDYHGSLTEQHGTCTVVGLCNDCKHCDEACDELWESWYWSLPRRDQDRAVELFDRQYGHVFPRYELVDENGGHLLHVRRASFTPANSDEPAAVTQ